MDPPPPPASPDPDPAAAGEARAALAQVRAERDDLRERCDRLQASLDAASDGVWDADLVSGRVRFSAGWARMLGYEPGELDPTVTQVLALTHPDDHRRVEETFRHHLAAGPAAGYRLAFRLVHRNGHAVEVIARGRAIRDGGGRAIRFIGTHVDVTQAVREAEGLREDRSNAEAARRAAEAMAGGVIAGVRAALDTLASADDRAEEAKPAAVRGLLDAAFATLDDADTLLRLRTRPPRPRRAAFVLTDLLEAVQAAWGPEAAARGLTLSCRASADAPARCFADRDLLRDALDRMLGRVIATAPGGAVGLTAGPGACRGTDHREEAIAFSVRGEGGAAGAAAGDGLQLAIAGRLVSILGGELETRDEPAIGPAGDPRAGGSGVGFTLRFPRDAVAEPSSEEPGESPAPEAAGAAAIRAAARAARAVDDATPAWTPAAGGNARPAAVIEREILALHTAGELTAAGHRLDDAQRRTESMLHETAAARRQAAREATG